MSCDTVRNRVLLLPDPRAVPDPLRGHLTACADCAAWWDRAVRVERIVAALPVPPPPTEAKAEFLDELTAAGPVIRRLPEIDRRPGWLTRAAPSAKYVAALAAAVLVAVGGWWAVRPGPGGVVQRPTQKHPLLDQLVRRNLELTQARTPADRLAASGGMADDLAAEVKELARVASPDELRDLSAMYRTAADGVVRQAEAAPPDRADQIGRLAAGLDRVGREVAALSAESPPQAQPALRAVAEAADDGGKRLRAIAADKGGN